MRNFSILFAIVLVVAAPTQTVAQNMCATPSGSCAMNVPGAPGGPCFCVTQFGNVQGITQAGGAGDPFPHFCCTPAGRMGPYPNATVGPGGPCQAGTPTGMLIGQACY
jgi:hypothetical protein